MEFMDEDQEVAGLGHSKGGSQWLPVQWQVTSSGLRIGTGQKCQDQPMVLLCHSAGSSAGNPAGARAGVPWTAAKASSQSLWFSMWTWQSGLGAEHGL